MKDLAWYDKLQYGAMLLMAAAMPIDFHCGLWAAGLLAIVSLVKMIGQRRVCNRSLSLPLAMALGGLVLYWLIHLVSVSYGGDTAVGMRVVELKAVLLIFAGSFLLTDTSYLGERHIRWLFYALWLSVCGVFLYYVGEGIVKLVGGSSLAAVVGPSFDPRHHAYTALYVDTALAFVYIELVSRWSALRRWLRGVLIGSVPALVLYVLMVNSRAGVLVMWMVAVLCLLHMIFIRLRWWKVALTAVLFASFAFGMGRLLPGHSDRLLSTIENVTSDDPSDARIEITKSALQLALERPILGRGAGIYRSDMVDRYESDGFDYGVTAEFNAHNQYVETVLSVGLVGLIFLMAFLLVPLWRAWCGRRYLMPALLLTASVCANLLFESMLERQMGLLFIGYFMTVMVLLINLEENKFGQSSKS